MAGEGERTSREGARRRRRPRILGVWLPILLVCVLFIGAFASWRLDLGPRLLGTGGDPVSDPAAVPAPEGMDLPELTEPAPVARPVQAADGGRIAPARVRSALAPYVGNRKLGRDVLAVVAGAEDPGPAYGELSETTVPASTMKLLTSTAALETIGSEHRFTTEVVRAPGKSASRSGTAALTLVGGGDPYLGSRPVPAGERAATYPRRADVTTLAQRTASALRKQGVRRASLSYDDTLFTGPDAAESWPDSYLVDVVSRISALWVDRGDDPDGYGHVDDPALAAAQTYASALRRAGITITGRIGPAAAPPSAQRVAAVESAPLGQIVQHLLDVSDNEAAEVVAHHVGIAVEGEGSFTAGARGVVRTLTSLGVDMTGARVLDGSGLSRRNVLTGGALIGTLQTALDPEHTELREVVTGLPVAGFTGSLAYRFATGDEAGPGRVRAKTGTLTGVHGLAGVATDLDGNLMVFALVADRVNEVDTLKARDTLDDMAAALAGCHCGIPAR